MNDERRYPPQMQIPFLGRRATIEAQGTYRGRTANARYNDNAPEYPAAAVNFAEITVNGIAYSGSVRLEYGPKYVGDGSDGEPRYETMWNYRWNSSHIRRTNGGDPTDKANDTIRDAAARAVNDLAATAEGAALFAAAERYACLYEADKCNERAAALETELAALRDRAHAMEIEAAQYTPVDATP